MLDAQTREGAQRAEVRVLETLRGPALPERITVVAGAGALLEGDVDLEPGRTLLLLVSRAQGVWRVPPGLRQAALRVDDDAQRETARALLGAYLAGGAALDAKLRESVALAHARLRAGVLEDLSQRLVVDDAALLLRLARQPEQPREVRVFAIRGLAGLGAPLPEALAELQDSSQPLAVRLAVLDAYAARGERERVARGLADPNPLVRGSAVDDLDAPEDVARLELHYPGESALPVRLAIVRQLGLIGTEAARAALRRIAAAPGDPVIRRAAEPWLESVPPRGP